MDKKQSAKLSDIGQAALEIAKKYSWRVFPCSNLSKGPIIPKSEGGNGFKDATCEPDRIIEWWTKYPQAIIGVATGAASGFYAVDLDRKEGMGDGLATWRQWEIDLDAETDVVLTRQHKTPSTGRHMLFKYIPGIGSIPLGKLGEGVEIKGDGGYIIVPPSVMSNGSTYEGNNKEIADTPEWFVDKLRGYYAQRSGTGSEGSATGASADLSKVEAALNAIPCQDLDYNSWLHVGAALYKEYGDKGKPLFLKWSEKDKKRYKPGVVDKKWNEEITKFSKLTIGTVFHFANEHDEQWEIKWQTKQHSAPLELIDLFPIKEEEIPTRQWIVPGLLLRKHVTMTAAPGGTGKSVLTMCASVMLAANKAWARWKPRKQCRVLIINAEEDNEELSRRSFAVAMKSLGITDNSILKGWVRAAKNPASILVARYEPKTRNMIRSPLVDQLITTIRQEKIDVVVVDPFAETFLGEETVMELKWVAGLWREVARQTNCSVWLIHHTKKYASGMAGDIDAARGSGALSNVTRIGTTLFVMTKPEAQEFGITEDDRTLYIRFDDAKANYDRASPTAQWFRMETVHLQNSKGDIPGDNVGVPIPWTAPTALDGASDGATSDFLATVDKGLMDKEGNFLGEYYTVNLRQKAGDSINRWVGLLVQSKFKCDEGKARSMIKQWTKTNVLVEFDYRTMRRKWSTGCGTMAKKLAMEALPEAQARLFKDSK
jgi:Bifunctional DNA primase/polymerase, N-terminal/AAA domain/Primase C terminal 2 (PriCT-2)